MPSCGRPKKENYEYIYGGGRTQRMMKENLEPMFAEVYHKLLREAKEKDANSYLFRHHMTFVDENNRYSRTFSMEKYMETEPNQLVVDYIASMTDDYFVDLYHEMFPKGKYHIDYIGYFE